MDKLTPEQPYWDRSQIEVERSPAAIIARKESYIWAFAGMHHFWPCLFCGRVFSRFFLYNCSYLMASGVGMVGHFPTLQCNKHFRKNKNVSDKSRNILQICPQGIHIFGVASSYTAGVFISPQPEVLVTNSVWG